MKLQERTLRDGSRIPVVGVGTFGSDRYSAADVARGVETALEIGYRLVDCAAVYGNEDLVGRTLASAFDGGLARDDVFVMSKVWNDHHAPDRVRASVEKSLEDLRLDHLDACYIHWPFPNTHAQHAHVDERDPGARPYLHADFMRTWAALEDLVDEGLVRHAGLSNVTVPKLKLILPECRIQPSLAEIEHHPTLQQGELFQHLVDHGIQVVGYSPLGSPSRPERDRTEEDLVDLESPAVLRIAERRGISPAQVCVAWAVNRGVIPIPFSVKEHQLRELFDASAVEFTPEEFNALRGTDRNNRLIKGHVFLWEGAGSWLDLWDVDGTIPGWHGYAS
ncbi:aldo/keto reductase [Tessaracoccus sp. OS52]|uniref:aldo/keto reductase n=1 Tax=Tessaracoccus sp. OS52 TaxID=2886691 RepID=UPI001D119693|nr:aldo/keto reductase [Tessaracoccus sp. OS52]MCC2591875.1 aldo/keto reductase [Tessaracoccus sp. OS52]